jgi:hypothetical protein
MPNPVIAEADLIWHAAELPFGVGTARQRNLFVDERTGHALTIVQFFTEWTRSAGFGHRDTEWTVLEGSLRVGDDELGPLDHLSLPGGARVAPMTAEPGTRVAIWRHSSWYFDQSDWHQPWASGPVRVTEVAPGLAASCLAAPLALSHTPTVHVDLVTAGPGDGARPLGHEGGFALLVHGEATIGDERVSAPTFVAADTQRPLTATALEHTQWLVYSPR